MIVSEMRGRINFMDLYNAPYNLIHELYYYSFSIKDSRERERKAEEKKRKENEEKKNKMDDIKKESHKFFDRRLSPAAQAREIAHKKSQDDAKKREENNSEIAAETTPPRIDMEDLVDVLEEGG